ncbi:MAG: GNAT family N-acetyltransferase [Limosilactobacillus sp.]|uniref:GNAT family N-acetyltransferase n=1 Tax=Limosilactobacillus sp. TaxID=2773925 RepID=UPI0027084ABF|nr:GNAT family N-acetyltransferase [Limosilactobacillus sp.]
MEFKVYGNRIIALDANEKMMGEIDFPPVTDGRVVVERVFVDPDFRGQGVAGKLVKEFVDYAKKQDLTVKLMCPYAKEAFRRHPEYQELLLPEDRMD